MSEQNNPHIGSDFDDFMKEEGIYTQITLGVMLDELKRHLKAASKTLKDLEALKNEMGESENDSY